MKEELIMAKSRSKSARRRTQVKDLSKRNKKLSGKDMKKVKGGHSGKNTWIGTSGVIMANTEGDFHIKGK